MPRVLHGMIASHPYNTWPLHVKVFTEEADKHWHLVANASSSRFNLPLGFTCTVELEGVDGKSGSKGSGRLGAIDVKDGAQYGSSSGPHSDKSAELFTTAHLTKAASLDATNTRCSICREPILDLASVNVSVFCDLVRH